MAKGSTPNSSPIGECVPPDRSDRSRPRRGWPPTWSRRDPRRAPWGRIGGRQVVPGRLGGGRHRADRRDEPREGQRSSDTKRAGCPGRTTSWISARESGCSMHGEVGRPTGVGEALSMLRRCFRPRRASCSPVASSTWRPARCTGVGRSCSTGTGSRTSSPRRRALAGATVDLSARTVLPGPIDCHAHLIGELDDGQGYALARRSHLRAGGAHRGAERPRHGPRRGDHGPRRGHVPRVRRPRSWRRSTRVASSAHG